MARPRKPPTVNRYDDDKPRRRPFYVYAYPGGHRRAFTFADRETAEAFVSACTTRGHDAAAAAYDARAVNLKRVQGGKAEALTLVKVAAEFIATRDKEATKRAYTTHARYLAEYPATASLDVASLKAADLEGYAEFLRTRPNGRGGVMAPNTVHAAWTFTRTVLDRAVRQGYIRDNPARAVEDAPKPRRKGTDDLTARALAPEQFEAIMDRAPAKVRPLFRVLWASGMRVGEALALRWQDVRPTPDPDVFELYVAHSLTTGPKGTPAEGGRWVIGTTKSGRARRVPTRAEAFAGLDRGAPGEFVFGLTRDTYTNAWRAARDHAAAEGLAPGDARPHDLRHSRVTRLLSVFKVDPHVVAAQVGHASVAFMYDHYAHAMPSDALAVGKFV